MMSRFSKLGRAELSLTWKSKGNRYAKKSRKTGRRISKIRSKIARITLKLAKLRALLARLRTLDLFFSQGNFFFLFLLFMDESKSICREKAPRAERP